MGGSTGAGGAEQLAEEELRRRVKALAEELPEVELQEGQHIGMRIRGRSFAYYQVDHHGDGMITVVMKAAPGVQEEMVDTEPDRFFVPTYVGARGWIGYDLEAPTRSWDELRAMLREAYCLQAPKTLAGKITAP